MLNQGQLIKTNLIYFEAVTGIAFLMSRLHRELASISCRNIQTKLDQPDTQRMGHYQHDGNHMQQCCLQRRSANCHLRYCNCSCDPSFIDLYSDGLENTDLGAITSIYFDREPFDNAMPIQLATDNFDAGTTVNRLHCYHTITLEHFNGRSFRTMSASNTANETMLKVVA